MICEGSILFQVVLAALGRIRTLLVVCCSNMDSSVIESWYLHVLTSSGGCISYVFLSIFRRIGVNRDVRRAIT